MSVNTFIGLDTKRSQSIDQLHELLLKSNDLIDFIKLGLEWLTKNLNRSGAAIYLLDSSLKIAPVWIKYNVPSIWNYQLTDFQSQLVKDALQVYTTQIPLNENPDLQVSVILPLTSQENTIGVFVLAGELLTPEDLDFTNSLLSFFTKILVSELYVSSHWKEVKDVTISQTITSVVREMAINPNSAILNLMKGIRSYYNTDYLLFIQKDLETPQLIIKKLLSDKDEWLYQVNQHVPADFFEKITYPERPDEIQSLSIDNNSILDILDCPESQIHSIIYLPIILNNGSLLVLIPIQSKKSL
jgi:hypothetical protein